MDALMGRTVAWHPPALWLTAFIGCGAPQAIPPTIAPTVLFFHGLSGLENACDAGRLRPGQFVLFNGASFLADLSHGGLQASAAPCVTDSGGACSVSVGRRIGALLSRVPACSYPLSLAAAAAACSCPMTWRTRCWGAPRLTPWTPWYCGGTRRWWSSTALQVDSTCRSPTAAPARCR